METKKQKYPLINMGTSLMLVIFIILCFIIFSTLSLSSSLRDRNLLSFQEKIDKNQELEIQLQLTNDQNRYKIIKWEKHSSTKWENKTSLPLIGND